MHDGPTEKKYQNREGKGAKAKAKPDSSTSRQLGEIISMRDGPTEKRKSFEIWTSSSDINEKNQ